MHGLNEKYSYSNSYKRNSNEALQTLYSRRAFLKRIVAASAAGLIIPGLLTACGNGDAGEDASEISGRTATGNEGSASNGCPGEADLSTQEQVSRKAVAYVAESPHAEKFCANCRFFKQPAQDSVCGGCEVVPGPIHPEGYCNAWVAQS